MNIQAVNSSIFDNTRSKWQNTSGKYVQKKNMELYNNRQVNQSTSNVDSKLQKIMNRFKAGNKLSPAELQYLAQEDPAAYETVKKILQERQALEQQMENSESKEEAKGIALTVQAVAQKSEEDPEMMFAAANQFQNAIREVSVSEEYKGKSERPYEEKALEERDDIEALETAEKIPDSSNIFVDEKNNGMDNEEEKNQSLGETADIVQTAAVAQKTAISKAGEGALEFSKYKADGLAASNEAERRRHKKTIDVSI